MWDFYKIIFKRPGIKYFEKNMVYFFAGGTGIHIFQDMTMVLRAVEIDADCIFAAKSIDGVYDSDPYINRLRRNMTKFI
jgi:uridylate kinase